MGIGTRDDVRELERDLMPRRNVVSMDRLFRQQRYRSAAWKLAALITRRRISKRQQTSIGCQRTQRGPILCGRRCWLCLELWQHLQKTTST